MQRLHVEGISNVTPEQNVLFCELLFQDDGLTRRCLQLQSREQQPGYRFEEHWNGFIREKYAEFADTYREVYGDIPPISSIFACEYVNFPSELEHDAPEGRTLLRGYECHVDQMLDKGISEGVYINSRFRGFRGASLNVLLHEMIHVSGVPNHGPDFYKKLDRLYCLGAFRDSL